MEHSETWKKAIDFVIKTSAVNDQDLPWKDLSWEEAVHKKESGED